MIRIQNVCDEYSIDVRSKKEQNIFFLSTGNLRKWYVKILKEILEIQEIRSGIRRYNLL